MHQLFHQAMKQPARIASRRTRHCRLVLIFCAIVTAGCGLACNDRDDGARTEPSATARSDTTARAPNLIVVTVDTTRADALGAYGQQRPTTPNLDRLAREGVVFEQAMTSNPETLPSHATLFTGRWPFSHGVRANAGYALSDRYSTLAERLRDHGYATGAEIAVPVLRRETNITRGFDHHRDTRSPGVVLKEIKFTRGVHRTATVDQRIASDITDSGIRLLGRHRDEPFFLWLHYFDPHNPYSAPSLFNKKIPDSTYHAEIASADFHIGRLVQELERLGLRERTIVVVASDHGEGLGEHGEPSHSFFIYESTMHVPLILWGPKSLRKGTRIPSLVRTVDLMPTLLELMGLPAETGIDGVSLAPLIEGHATDLGLTAYGEATRFLSVFGLPVLRSVREGRWKYIHKVNPELYDLVLDPSETRNVIDQHGEIADRLRGRLAELIEGADAPDGSTALAMDPQTAAELEALGYAAVGPGAFGRDALDSLALEGPDPATRIDDTRLISEAQGLLDRQEFSEAMVRLEPVRDNNPDSTYVLGLIVRGQIGLDETDDAIRTLRRLVALEPCNEEHLVSLGSMLRGDGRYEEVLEIHRVNAAECPLLVKNLNNYAWALATLPDPKLRDGKQAIEVVRRALDQLEEPTFEYLDTLAAAQAERGDFEAAIETSDRALSSARKSGLPEPVLALLGQHREAFVAGEAIRDPAENAR